MLYLKSLCACLAHVFANAISAYNYMNDVEAFLLLFSFYRSFFYFTIKFNYKYIIIIIITVTNYYEIKKNKKIKDKDEELLIKITLRTFGF